VSRRRGQPVEITVNERPELRTLRAAVLIGAAVLFLTRLGATDLWAPDEPRYAQIAEEIRAMKEGPEGLILLHLNGEAYTQKPPFYYWLAALAGAPGGRVTEFAARLPSALAGVATVWLTLRLGTRLMGGAAGATGAALLLTTPLFAHLARRVQLDVLLALLELAALSAFWAFDSGPRRGGRGALALLHGAMGMAVLTKGPVGFLVPALVILAFLAWERRLRDARRLFPPWALLLSLGPGAAWFAAATHLAAPGFFGDAFVDNVLLRFFHSTAHPRPFYYYLYQFPALFLPWTLLWPLVWRTGRRHAFAPGGDPRAWRFLLAWVAVTVVFFSFSSGKRGLYLLPAFAPAALLCGDALVRALLSRRALPRAVTLAAAALAAVACVLAVGEIVIDEVRGIALPDALGAAVLATVITAAGAWAAAGRAASPARLRAGIAIAALFAVELSVFALLLPAVNVEKSYRSIAVAAAAEAGEGGRVGLMRDRPMLGGLLYYGGRPVVLLKSPEELRAFIAEGGRAIVVKAKKLDQVETVAPVEVKARTHSGWREMLVVTPKGAPPA
jgi:4-amino-4-deoxy-L-arabinose transferase-like glycosyltransferase